MVRMTKRAWILVLLYAGVLAVGSGYRFFYHYGVTEWRRVTEEIQSFRSLYADSEAMLDREQEVAAEYERVQEKLHYGHGGETAATEILQDIKTKAQDAGLHVINIKPFGLKQDGQRRYGAFDFKLETEGNLVNLGNFLYHLDASPYVFGVKHTQINAHAQGGLLKFQLLLSALVTGA